VRPELFDGFQEFGGGAGFLEEAFVGSERMVLQQPGAAADENDSDLGPVPCDVVGQVEAVEALAEIKVGYQDFGRATVRHEVERLLCGRGLGYIVPAILQHLGQDVPNGILILDKQNGCHGFDPLSCLRVLSRNPGGKTQVERDGYFRRKHF
jgi:hypothetical protein